METNGSLCFNTAAGCISRHQLVQFHNRMGPRAQRGLRCTVWQHKCHNSSFFNCILIYLKPAGRFQCAKCKIEAEPIFWERCQAAERCTFHARLLDEGKSHHPKNWSCGEATPTDTALGETLSGFHLKKKKKNRHCRVSVHTEDDTGAQFTAPTQNRKRCIYLRKKRTKWCSANTVAFW